MALFASWGQTLEQAVAYATRIFHEQGAITLTTGHKAKGKEWDVVYHLDPHLCRNDDQDLNLRYVITTRSANQLYEVKSNGHE
jgi:superfamily I DNA/RNA helicase